MAEKINNKVVSKISYSYDPFGRRIQKKSYAPGESPFASTDHFCEKGSSVFPLALHEKTERYLYDANGNIQMSFVHGPGVDEPLSVTYYKKQNPKKDKAEKETNYYTADALGSIVRITDEKGHIVESYAYDTFGNFRDSGNDRNDSDLHSDRGWGDGHDNNYDSKTEIQQPFAYTGREYDEETGLYYYRARYYDPSVGRFISKDPVIGFVEYPSSQNRFSYVYNNPVRYVDASGESATLIAGACVIGAVG